MDEDSASSQDYARDRAQKAFEVFKNSKRGAKTLSGYLNLVKGYYLPEKIYAEHEDIVTETWNANQRNPRSPTSTDSTTRSSSEAEAIDVTRDNTHNLPSLELEAKPRHLWLPLADRRFVYASYKRSKSHGSYIRADSMRNNNLSKGVDGLVVVQWIPCGHRDVKDDQIAMHTACRVVEPEAKNDGMNVDLILGKDCHMELGLQEFVRTSRVSENLAMVAQNAMSVAGATLSNQQPEITHHGAHLSRINIAIQLPTGPQISRPFLGGHREMVHCLVQSPHGAVGMPGNAIVEAGAAEHDGIRTREPFQQKHQMADEHAFVFRDRAERL